MGSPSDAHKAWTLLLEMMSVEARLRLSAAAAELGLSEAQCQVLQQLDPQRPIAMCRLAEALDCDPSNVTGIVDRLEARHLVERRIDPRDRRVKKLLLTGRGREQRQRLLAALSEPPSAIAALSETDQKSLCAILRRVADRGRRS
jgi:MarR family transcriptional regulator, organic hydroperoxide resistance regulator